MPVKIRLQRHGKKGKPFYWLVAADSRAKRDGKYLEKLGIYNPNTNPATIEVNVDNSVRWLQNGAQPSETAKRILSYKGVLLKHHLLGGVRKGALTEEQVEERFNAWVTEKEKAIADKAAGLDKEKADARAKALAAEKEVSEKRALAAVEAEVAETAVAAEASEEAPVAETADAAEAPAEEIAKAETEVAAVEEPATESPAEAATEVEAVEEPATESPAEAATEVEAVEEPAAEVKEEAVETEDSEEKAKASAEEE